MGGKRKWVWRGAALFLLAAVAFFSWLLYEPKYQGKAMGQWVAELNSTDERTRRLAENAVAEMGPSAIPYLKQNIAVTGRGKHPKLRDFGLSISQKLPKEMGVKFRRRFGLGGSFNAGSGAARTLAAWGEDSKDAVPELLAALHEEDPNVRSHAACALIQIAPDERETMQTLFATVVKDPEDWILSNVGNYFYRLPPTSAFAPSLLMEVMPKAKPQTQFGILSRLGSFQPPRNDVLELLNRSLEGTNLTHKVAAAIALSHLGNTNHATLDAIVEGAGSKDLLLQSASMKRLAELGRAVPQAKDAMIQALGSPWALIRVYAANFLHDLVPHTYSIPAILHGEGLDRADFQTQAWTLKAFADVRRIHLLDWSELRFVTNQFKSVSPSVREAALKAYQRYATDDPSLPLGIFETCLTDEDMLMRFRAASALAVLKPDNEKLHEALKRWLTTGGYTSRLESVRLIASRPEFVSRYRKELEALRGEKGERLRKAVSEALEAANSGSGKR